MSRSQWEGKITTDFPNMVCEDQKWLELVQIASSALLFQALKKIWTDFHIKREDKISN